MKLFFFKIFAVFGILWCVRAEMDCSKMFDSQKTCVSIYKCMEFEEFIDWKNLTRAEYYYLSQFICNFTPLGDPMVCCSQDAQGISSKSPAATLELSSRALPGKDTCGISSGTKIFGGQATELDEFPWAALLKYRRKNRPDSILYACGGILISKRFVLTAAHCLTAEHMLLLGVRLGEHRLSTNTDCVDHGVNGQDCIANQTIDVGIMSVTIHPNYDKRSYVHDVALVKLAKDIEFTEFIKPICLPLSPTQLYRSYVGERLYVTGWGDTGESRQSDVKMKVQVPVRDMKECSTKYPIAVDERRQLCAGGEDEKDSCRGDSGGPLMAVDEDGPANWHAVGIVSFGPVQCGSSKWPAIYTRVGAYVSWIIETIEKE